MGLLGGARAANRMGTRQQYRTMARMQRRRSYIEQRAGAPQDFRAGQEQPTGQEPEPQAQEEQAAGQPAYLAELEQLSQLKEQGVITDEEFEAKKKQLLNI